MHPVRAVHDHLDTSQGQNPFRKVADKCRYAATGEEVTRKCNIPSSNVTNYGLVGTGCLRKLDTLGARRLLHLELGNLMEGHRQMLRLTTLRSKNRVRNGGITTNYKEKFQDRTAEPQISRNISGQVNSEPLFEFLTNLGTLQNTRSRDIKY